MFTQPKQKRGRQRVDAILNAASELFAEVGYESATIIEIAARANTSVGSMYQGGAKWRCYAQLGSTF